MLSFLSPNVNRFVASWAWVVAWAAMIFVLSSFSTLPRIPAESGDKYAHVIAYSVLAVLVCRALAAGAWRTVTWRHAWGAVGLALLYGATDELHQIFVPNRHTSLSDLAADALGALLGVALLRACAIIATTRRRVVSEQSPIVSEQARGA